MPNNDRIFLYRFLPDEIRAFFLESGLSDVEQIAKTYGLSNEAVDELDRIQQEVLFGYEQVDKVRNLIQERLKFDEKLATNVALDVIEKRFLPVDSFLGATAFRTFANLGGNPTVANIKRVDASGGTVTDVRRRVSEYAVQAAVEVKKEELKVTVPSPKAAEEVKEAVETTRAFDAVMDKQDGNRDPARAVHVSEQVKLDPSHELTAPALSTLSPSSLPTVSTPSRQTGHLPLAGEEAGHTPSRRGSETRDIEGRRGGVPKETVVKVKPPVKRLSLPGIEEEAEVAKMMQKLQQSGTQAPPSIEHSKIDEVQRRLSLTFPSAELEKRFRVVLGARLSGVRSSDAFKTALGRSVVDGGLGMDAHTIERIVEEVDGHKETTESSATNRQKQGKEEYVGKRVEQYKEGEGRKEKVLWAPATSDAVKQPKRSEATATLSKPSITTAPIEGKRPVVDVTYERRLVGPLDELKRMTLADFRRLPGTVNDRIEAIRQDVDALRVQDPALRIQAIEAWRSSPLMRLYQRLLALALQDGAPVERVLADHAKNPDRMQPEEITAVRAFNRTLRF